MPKAAAGCRRRLHNDTTGKARVDHRARFRQAPVCFTRSIMRGCIGDEPIWTVRRDDHATIRPLDYFVRGLRTMHPARYTQARGSFEQASKNMPLEGQRILLVEDNFLIALDIATVIRAHRGIVVAQALTLKVALKHAEIPGITAAILDSRLGADDAFPVAQKLAGLGVPFFFYTGRTFTEIAKAWPNAIILLKPASNDAIVRALLACTKLPDAPATI